MSEFSERIHIAGENVVEKVEKLIHEGNVRRVVIKHHDHVVAEFPLTIGVIGALIAPTLAAIGAIVAVLSDSTIEVERNVTPPTDTPPTDPTL